MDERYSPKVAAGLLNVTEETLRRWLREGRLEGEKIGTRWYISDGAIRDFLRLGPDLLPSLHSLKPGGAKGVVKFRTILGDRTIHPLPPENIGVVIDRVFGRFLAGSSGVGKSTSPLSLFIDLDEFTEEDVADLLAELSSLYRALGGDGLVIRRTLLLDPTRQSAPV